MVLFQLSREKKPRMSILCEQTPYTRAQNSSFSSRKSSGEPQGVRDVPMKAGASSKPPGLIAERMAVTDSHAFVTTSEEQLMPKSSIGNGVIHWQWVPWSFCIACEK